MPSHVKCDQTQVGFFGKSVTVPLCRTSGLVDAIAPVVFEDIRINPQGGSLILDHLELAVENAPTRAFSQRKAQPNEPKTGA